MLEVFLLNSFEKFSPCILCRPHNFLKPEPSKSLGVECHVNAPPTPDCSYMVPSLRDASEAGDRKRKPQSWDKGHQYRTETLF